MELLSRPCCYSGYLSETELRTQSRCAALTALLFLACLAGELLERYLFFAAVAAPRMPGGIR